MFRGKKVLLREYREGDLKNLKSILNEQNFMRYAASRTPYPRLMNDVIEDYRSISHSKDYYDFEIESIEEGVYIGECGIKTVDFKNSRAEIYIFIGEQYSGRGYGTDAVKVLLDFIFNQMNVHKVSLTVFSFNTRAIRCYEKCGFKVEGCLRNEIFKDGKYHDSIAMGILKEEFMLQGNAE